MRGVLREQGGHAVAEAVWIRVPHGAAPVEKSREERLAGLHELVGVAAVKPCQQDEHKRVLRGIGQVGVNFTRARDALKKCSTLVRSPTSSGDRCDNTVVAVVNTWREGTAPAPTKLNL